METLKGAAKLCKVEDTNTIRASPVESAVSSRSGRSSRVSSVGLRWFTCDKSEITNKNYLVSTFFTLTCKCASYPSSVLAESSKKTMTIFTWYGLAIFADID